MLNHCNYLCQLLVNQCQEQLHASGSCQFCTSVKSQLHMNDTCQLNMSVKCQLYTSVKCQLYITDTCQLYMSVKCQLCTSVSCIRVSNMTCMHLYTSSSSINDFFQIFRKSDKWNFIAKLLATILNCTNTVGLYFIYEIRGVSRVFNAVRRCVIDIVICDC